MQAMTELQSYLPDGAHVETEPIVFGSGPQVGATTADHDR